MTKKIVDVTNLQRIKNAKTISEYKEAIIEKWILQNFRNVKIEHKTGYTILTDSEKMQMKIIYKRGKLELEYKKNK